MFRTLFIYALDSPALVCNRSAVNCSCSATLIIIFIVKVVTFAKDSRCSLAVHTRGSRTTQR